VYDVQRCLAERAAWAGSVLARPVAFRGVGARRLGEVAAVTGDGEVVGSVVGGVLDDRIRDAARGLGPDGPASRLLVLDLPDADAAAAGLACGGRVSVLLQRADAVPERAVAALAAGGPVLLATDLEAGTVRLVEAPAGASADADERAQLLARLARAGRPDAVVTRDEVLEAFVPPTRLLLVGSGVLAAAVAAQATLLGWESATFDEVADVVAALPGLGPGGALVTFAHRGEVDDPVLAAALGAGLRYVGALGSRRTQAARRERLRASGLAEADLDRVHGPVGLDLGARTPEETALAVCAEVLAVLGGRSAASLRGTAGPVHG
jgi:xanthine dehydrogenase accessory factor